MSPHPHSRTLKTSQNIGLVNWANVDSSGARYNAISGTRRYKVWTAGTVTPASMKWPNGSFELYNRKTNAGWTENELDEEWLGDALFEMAVRKFTIKMVGHKDVQFSCRLKDGVYQRRFLEDVCPWVMDHFLVRGTSEHNISRAFEVAYWRSAAFRQNYWEMVSGDHEVEEDLKDHAPLTATTQTVPLTMISMQEGMCWTQLFVKPADQLVRSTFALGGWMSKKQLQGLAGNEWSTKRWHAEILSADRWHLVEKRDGLPGSELVASMTNRARLGSGRRGGPQQEECDECGMVKGSKRCKEFHGGAVEDWIDINPRTNGQLANITLPEPSSRKVKCTCWSPNRWCEKHAHKSQLRNDGTCARCPVAPTSQSKAPGHKCKPGCTWNWCWECQSWDRRGGDQRAKCGHSPAMYAVTQGWSLKNLKRKCGSDDTSPPSKEDAPELSSSVFSGKEDMDPWKVGIQTDLELSSGDVWHVPSFEDAWQEKIVQKVEKTPRGFKIVNAGNDRTIESYIEHNLLETDKGKLLVAPCGLGKSKFAPGLLAKRLGFKRVTMLTERITSTRSTFEWYKTRMPEGIDGVSLRAGGKSEFAGKRDGTLLRAMTTNAWCDGNRYVAPDELVILDEAHNVTSGTVCVMNSVPANNLVRTTATPLDRGLKADFATPKSSTIYGTTHLDDDDVLEQLRQPFKSALIIKPTVADLGLMAAKLRRDGHKRVVTFSSAGGLLNDKEFHRSELEAFCNENGSIVVSTDVLQESVTLGVDKVFDFGKRVRPSGNRVIDLKNSRPGPMQGLKRMAEDLTASQEVITDITLSEMGQIAGRVGRTTRSEGGKVWIQLPAVPKDDPAASFQRENRCAAWLPLPAKSTVLEQSDLDKLKVVQAKYDETPYCAASAKLDRVWEEFLNLKVGDVAVLESDKEIVRELFNTHPKAPAAVGEPAGKGNCVTPVTERGHETELQLSGCQTLCRPEPWWQLQRDIFWGHKTVMEPEYFGLSWVSEQGVEITSVLHPLPQVIFEPCPVFIEGLCLCPSAPKLFHTARGPMHFSRSELKRQWLRDVEEEEELIEMPRAKLREAKRSARQIARDTGRRYKKVGWKKHAHVFGEDLFDSEDDEQLAFDAEAKLYRQAVPQNHNELVCHLDGDEWDLCEIDECWEDTVEWVLEQISQEERTRIKCPEPILSARVGRFERLSTRRGDQSPEGPAQFLERFEWTVDWFAARGEETRWASMTATDALAELIDAEQPEPSSSWSSDSQSTIRPTQACIFDSESCVTEFEIYQGCWWGETLVEKEADILEVWDELPPLQLSTLWQGKQGCFRALPEGSGPRITPELSSRVRSMSRAQYTRFQNKTGCKCSFAKKNEGRNLVESMRGTIPKTGTWECALEEVDEEMRARRRKKVSTRKRHRLGSRERFDRTWQARNQSQPMGPKSVLRNKAWRDARQPGQLTRQRARLAKADRRLQRQQEKRERKAPEFRMDDMKVGCQTDGFCYGHLFKEPYRSNLFRRSGSCPKVQDLLNEPKWRRAPFRGSIYEALPGIMHVVEQGQTDIWRTLTMMDADGRRKSVGAGVWRWDLNENEYFKFRGEGVGIFSRRPGPGETPFSSDVWPQVTKANGSPLLRSEVQLIAENQALLLTKPASRFGNFRWDDGTNIRLCPDTTLICRATQEHDLLDKILAEYSDDDAESMAQDLLTRVQQKKKELAAVRLRAAEGEKTNQPHPKEVCGHTHDDFAALEQCRHHCEHRHEHFEEKLNCLDAAVRLGVVDYRPAYEDCNEEVVVSTQESYPVFQGTVLYPERMARILPQLTSFIPASQSGWLTAAAVLSHLKEAPNCAVSNEDLGVVLHWLKPNGLYTFSRTPSHRLVIRKFKRMNWLISGVQENPHVNMDPILHYGLSSSLCQAGLATLDEERMHTTGLACRQFCNHHPLPVPTPVPARTRRACREYCSHTHDDFRERPSCRRHCGHTSADFPPPYDLQEVEELRELRRQVRSLETWTADQENRIRLERAQLQREVQEQENDRQAALQELTHWRSHVCPVLLAGSPQPHECSDPAVIRAPLLQQLAEQVQATHEQRVALIQAHAQLDEMHREQRNAHTQMREMEKQLTARSSHPWSQVPGVKINLAKLASECTQWASETFHGERERLSTLGCAKVAVLALASGCAKLPPPVALEQSGYVSTNWGKQDVRLRCGKVTVTAPSAGKVFKIDTGLEQREWNSLKELRPAERMVAGWHTILYVIERARSGQTRFLQELGVNMEQLRRLATLAKADCDGYRVRTYKRNWDRATAMGKGDPGPCLVHDAGSDRPCTAESHPFDNEYSVVLNRCVYRGRETTEGLRDPHRRSDSQWPHSFHTLSRGVQAEDWLKERCVQIGQVVSTWLEQVPQNQTITVTANPETVECEVPTIIFTDRLDLPGTWTAMANSLVVRIPFIRNNPRELAIWRCFPWSMQYVRKTGHWLNCLNGRGGQGQKQTFKTEWGRSLTRPCVVSSNTSWNWLIILSDASAFAGSLDYEFANELTDVGHAYAGDEISLFRTQDLAACNLNHNNHQGNYVSPKLGYIREEWPGWCTWEYRDGRPRILTLEEPVVTFPKVVKTGRSRNHGETKIFQGLRCWTDDLGQYPTGRAFESDVVWQSLTTVEQTAGTPLEQWAVAEIAFLRRQFQDVAPGIYEVVTSDVAPKTRYPQILMWSPELDSKPMPHSWRTVIQLPPSFNGGLPMAKARLLPSACLRTSQCITRNDKMHWDFVDDKFSDTAVVDLNGQGIPMMEGAAIPSGLYTLEDFYRFYQVTRNQWGADEVFLYSLPFHTKWFPTAEMMAKSDIFARWSKIGRCPVQKMLLTASEDPNKQRSPWWRPFSLCSIRRQQAFNPSLAKEVEDRGRGFESSEYMCRSQPYKPMMYRNNERSWYRHAGNGGLHWCDFADLTDDPPLHNWDAILDDLKLKYAGERIVVTANGDTPTSHMWKGREQGWKWVDVGTGAEGWTSLHLPLETDNPREWAMTRLIFLFVGAKEVWVCNGRNAREQKRPHLIRNRMHSLNLHNMLPICLASMRTDIILPMAEWSRYKRWLVNCADTYGSDEVFLQDYPLSVTWAFGIAGFHWLIFPRDHKFKDVEAWNQGELKFKGELARWTYEQPRAKLQVVSWWHSVKTVFDTREDAKLQELTWVEWPQDLTWQERSESWLLVVAGTELEQNALIYLGKWIQAEGQKVVGWRTEHAAEQLASGLPLLKFKGVVCRGLAPHRSMLRVEIGDGRKLRRWRDWSWSGLLRDFVTLSQKPEIRIGCTEGCNFPLSVDGYNRLVPLDGPETEDVCVWNSIETKLPDVTGPEDKMEEIPQRYAKVIMSGSYCAEMQARTWSNNVVNTEGSYLTDYKEPLASIYPDTSGLKHHIRRINSEWVSPLATIRRHAERFDIWDCVRLMLALFYWFGLIIHTVTWIATFPKLWDFVPFQATVYQVLAVLIRYPALNYARPWHMYVLALAQFTQAQYAGYLLAKGRQTTMRIRLGLIKGIPMLEHITLLDRKNDEAAEYTFRGPQSFASPFTGVWYKGIKEDRYAIEIPVPINFRAVARVMRSTTVKYRTYSNCQSLAIRDLQAYTPLVYVLLITQLAVLPLGLGLEVFLLASKKLGLNLCELTHSEFFRFGSGEDDFKETIEEWEHFDDDDNEEEEEVEVERAIGIVSGTPELNSRAPVTISLPQDERPEPSSSLNPLRLDDMNEIEVLKGLIMVASDANIQLDVDDETCEEWCIYQAHKLLTERVANCAEETWKPVELPMFSDWVNTFRAILYDIIHQGSTIAPVAIKCLEWLNHAGRNTYQAMEPLFWFLYDVKEILKAVWGKWMDRLREVILGLGTALFGKQALRGLKAAWGLGDNLPYQALGLQQQLRDHLAMAEFEDAVDFHAERESTISALRANWKKEDVNKVALEIEEDDKRWEQDIPKQGFGGPQWRPMRWVRPILSAQEIENLKLAAHSHDIDVDYILDPYLTMRNERLADLGVPQAIDGAMVGQINPDQTYRSIERYVWRQAVKRDSRSLAAYEMSAEERQSARQCGDAIYKRMPGRFDKPRLSPPMSYLTYMRRRGMLKYNMDTYGNAKTRAMALRKGLLQPYFRLAMQELGMGHADAHSYGVFNKRQPVVASKIVHPKADGTYKPVRTVVAQDLKHNIEDWVVAGQMATRMPEDNWNTIDHIPAGQAYSGHFRKVLAMDTVAEGDMEQFDARLEQWHMAIVDRCIELGCDDETIRSWLQVHQKQMMNSHMFILSVPRGGTIPEFLSHAGRSKRAGYENVFAKVCGGATGESRTHWTDDVASQGTFCQLFVDYCAAVGIPGSHDDFMNNSSEHITITSGDDNMWGSNHFKRHGHTIDPTILIACAKNRNMNLEIIIHDDKWNVEMLGCRAREPTDKDNWERKVIETLIRESDGQCHPELIKFKHINPRMNDPVTKTKPDIIVYRNLQATLTRMTGRNLGKATQVRGETYLEMDIKASARCNLTAGSPRWHQMIQEEALGSMYRYIYGGYPNARRNQAGVLLMPDEELRKKIDSWLGFSKTDMDGHMWCFDKLQRIPCVGQPAVVAQRVNFCRQMRPLPYSVVMCIHYGHGLPSHEAEIKKWEKILRGEVRWDEPGREKLEQARQITKLLTRKMMAIVKTQARDMKYLEPVYDNQHYLIEAFIWTAWVYKVRRANAERARIPEDETEVPEMPISQWEALCSKAALGNITDPMTFFAKMQNKEFREKIFSEPWTYYQNAVTNIQVCYMLLYFIEKALIARSGIGFLYVLFMFMMIDMAKMYAIVSGAYWNATGEVHPVISSWMPRDPYIIAKKMASFMGGMIPRFVHKLTPWHLVWHLVGGLAVAFAAMFSRGQGLKPLAGTGISGNPWIVEMEQALETAEQNGTNEVTIQADTGVGKSSLGVAAIGYIQSQAPDVDQRDTVLAVPTKILLKDPFPPFLALGSDEGPESERRYQVLRAKVTKKADAHIFLGTYGHLINRVKSGAFDLRTTIFCLDEAHQKTPAARILYSLIKGECKNIIFLSATPQPFPSSTAVSYRAKIQKKNGYCARSMPNSVSSPTMYQRAREDRVPVMGMKHSPNELSDRALILCTTFRDLDDTREALQALRVSTWGPGLGVDLPPIVEVSSRVKPGTIEWTEREKAYKAGKYIALGTKQAATGMDIKPNPPWLLIDPGCDVEEHEGEIWSNLPTDDARKRQAWGRVMRNSADRDGLIYYREMAGTRQWEVTNYPETAFCSEEIISKGYNLPLLKPVEEPVCASWPVFKFAEVYPENFKQALTFANLAYSQGVGERQMKGFYERHWVDGWKLSEDYEWLEGCMGRHVMKASPPSWDALVAIMHTKPFLWNVRANSIVGATLTHDKRQSQAPAVLYRAGCIRPIKGQFHQFQCLLADQPKHVEGLKINVERVNEEAQIYEQIKERYEEALYKASEQIARLKKRNAKMEDVVAIETRLAQMARTAKVTPELSSRLAFLERPKAWRVYPHLSPFETQSQAPGDGWGFCELHGTGAIVDASGPHTHNSFNGAPTKSLPCGCPIHVEGKDHVIHPGFIVCKRGREWRSVYEVDEVFVRTHKQHLEKFKKHQREKRDRHGETDRSQLSNSTEGKSRGKRGKAREGGGQSQAPADNHLPR